jgi:hypothetical protein
LDNYLNLSYEGHLYMGHAFTDVRDVVYDTGSAWLTLKSKTECSACDAFTYDTTTSTEFTQIPSSAKTLTYGSA